MKRTRKSEARFAVRDRDAEALGYLRIVDESGEDYGYAADRFFGVDLPKPLERVLLNVAS